MRGMSLVLAAVLLSGPALRGKEPGGASETPEDRLKALQGEYKAAVEGWAKQYDGEPGKADPAARYRHWPAWSFAPRFLELAEENPKSPITYDALIEIVRFGENVSEMDRELLPSFERATDLLLRDYIQDTRMKHVCEMMFDRATPPRERLLRAVLGRSRDREVRAWACLSLASCLAAKREAALTPSSKDTTSFITQRIDPSYFEYIRGADPEALYDEARSHFERTVEEFGDIKVTNERFKTLADAAKFFSNKLTKASIGKPAPEVEGEDADGKKFRLSDYRGKVVVLTFSGNWCGPCRSMYPHERELVVRLKDRPFALLSVNTDEDRKTLRKAIAAGEITWRCWWESGIEGPICSQWSNEGFPNIYVIDPEGIIRYKFEGPPHPPTELDDAVDSLLGKAAAPTTERR